MQVIGVGQINVWPGGSLWIGEARASTAVHAHHALQISLAFRGVIRLRSPRGHWQEYGAALVPPHVEHAFDASGSLVANVFCEPESATGRKLVQRYGADSIAVIAEADVAGARVRLREAYAASARDEILNDAAQNVVHVLADHVPSFRATDPRIVKAVDAVSRRLDRPIALAEIAAAAHLSPSRFRHLFVAETGLPFRRYVLWQRLQRALQSALAGGSWAEAAHTASFADAAHLARTFRRMFGIAPSTLGDRSGPRKGVL